MTSTSFSPPNCSTSSMTPTSSMASTTTRRTIRSTPSSPILLLAFCCCAALLLLVTSTVRGADSDSSSNSDSDEFGDDMCECGPRCAGYQSVELCARCCTSVMRRKRFVPWQSTPAASVVKPSSLDASLDASLTRRRAAHSSTVIAVENGEPVEEADYLSKKVGSTKRGAQAGRTLGRNQMSLMRPKL